VAPKVKEGVSYVVLNMNNYTAFDEIFDVGYSEAQCWFELVEQYKGFYIYKYYKDGVSHYAISRSVIHPKAYVKRFSSEAFAKEAIDNNDDTIRSCGLWSIKQHQGTPRTS
jgi:hypothetical protein